MFFQTRKGFLRADRNEVLWRGIDESRGLRGPRERVPAPWTSGEVPDLSEVGDGMGADLDTMSFISKKIKPCQPQRGSYSLTWHGNRKKKNPVLFSAWYGRSKENCRF